MLMVHVINIIGVRMTNHSVYYKKDIFSNCSWPTGKDKSDTNWKFTQDGTLLYSIADVHMV